MSTLSQPGRGVRSRRLSKEAILGAALQIVDSEGLNALTIRRLADRLEVGTMTVYGYFKSKSEIVDALGAQLLGDLGAIVEADGSWEERLAEGFRRIRRTLREHPAARAFMLSSHVLRGPMLDHVRDDLIKVVMDAGFEAEAAFDAVAILASFVIGFSEVEAPSRGRADGQERRKFALLDPADYTHLTSVAEPWARGASDRTFESGLQFIIDGLRRRAEALESNT